MSDNLSLWIAVERTDPAATKGFSGKGGFKGTAISPMWLIKRATELWGPMGGKWGIRNVQSSVLEGLGGERLHVVQAEVFYPDGSIPCFGQTTLCGTRKDGSPYLDEEAPKKSLTDALTKGLSWLGFAADVHMGRYDDVKYVNQIKDEFREQDERTRLTHLREEGMKFLAGAAEQGDEALTKAWGMLSKAQREAVQTDQAALKALRAKAKSLNGKEVANAAS